MLGRDDAQKVLDQINEASDRVSWVLLDWDENTECALVLTRECIAKMPFHVEWSKITWEQCTLREWLNTDFYNSLSADVRERIVYTEIVNKDSCTIPGGNNTMDHVFLLSVDEYNAMPEELRAAKYNGSGCWWWLRTPGYDSYNFANVNRCGGLDGGLDGKGKYVGHGYHVDSDSGCVRPACFMKLNKL